MASSGGKRKAGTKARARSKKTDQVEDAVVIEEEQAPTEIEQPEPEVTVEPAPAPDASKAEDPLPDPQQETPPTAPAQPRRGGFAPLLIGGLVAGAVGFGASQFLGNDSWPFQSGPSEAEVLAKVVETQKSRIQALEADLNTLRNDLGSTVSRDDLTPVLQGQEALLQSVTDLGGKLAGLEQRIADLENRPIPDVGATADAVATYERELAAMREMFQKELERIEQAQQNASEQSANATKLAQDAAVKAAVAWLRGAADSGKPFADALAQVRGAGVPVPDVLSAQAESGIVTLAELQVTFPDAARNAVVAATKAAAQSGETSKVTAFLRTQLGARSLEPKEGDDPDAVLSRAEAALKAGDLKAALAEIDTLPEAGKEQMADWVATAQGRLDAMNALSALVAQLSE